MSLVAAIEAPLYHCSAVATGRQISAVCSRRDDYITWIFVIFHRNVVRGLTCRR
jgi:hypothetical protein